ncbi:hypothetical protein DPX16_1760 [Anabarilius grahami]|uniref:Uncharacterized protein n=1 Tax=Anabarilius grahami TaxID=495550 RepID=A0A3N0YA72_ANAGA|nr:hypothetical protein DPX16_1760 [Anabarilius grahami]
MKDLSGALQCQCVIRGSVCNSIVQTYNHVLDVLNSEYSCSLERKDKHYRWKRHIGEDPRQRVQQLKFSDADKNSDGCDGGQGY